MEHADLDVDGDAPDAGELGAQPLVQQEFSEKRNLDSECQVTGIYRVIQQVSDLGWVDFDLFACSIILPTCPASSAKLSSAQAESDR